MPADNQQNDSTQTGDSLASSAAPQASSDVLAQTPAPEPAPFGNVSSETPQSSASPLSQSDVNTKPEGIQPEPLGQSVGPEIQPLTPSEPLTTSFTDTAPAAPSLDTASPLSSLGDVAGEAGTSDTISLDTSTKPKKKFSKVYLLVLGIMLLLGALGFLAWKFMPTGFLGGKQGEITWWGLWEDESIINPIIEEYQQANPDIKITYVKQSAQDYRDRLTSSLARGEGPDIFRFHNTWVPMFKNELDVVPPSVISSEEFAKVYYPIILSDLTSGSGLVGIPLGYDALTLYINEDIFASAAKVPPKTWDDFRQLAIELTTKDEKGVIIQSGAALGRTENVDHWPEILAMMMLQNGVDLSRPSGQLAEDALGFYSVFSSVDKIWNETLPPSTIAFANGKTAMYFGPSWSAFEIKQLNKDLHFRTVPLPQLPKDNPGEPNISYATYWVEGVWARSTNKEAAWEFLKFLSSKETLEKLYNNASNTRLFGEPYPRTDMAGLLVDHPIVGSIINLAPEAKSWYLGSRTHDGPTGINSQITKYYEDAVNSMGKGRVSGGAMKTLESGVAQILSQYSLIRR